MCVVRECTVRTGLTTWTVKGVGSYDLCPAHLKLERHKCRGCFKLVRVGSTLVTGIDSRHDALSGIDVCTTCDTTCEKCPGCERILALEGKGIAEGTLYVGEPSTRVCRTCLTDHALCAACKKLVRAGGADIGTPVHLDPPDADLRLCRTCDGRPKNRCEGCRRLVVVDGKGVRSAQPYRGRTVYLCQDTGSCDSKVTVNCRMCEAPAALSTGTLTGAVVERSGRAYVMRRCRPCAAAGTVRLRGDALGLVGDALIWYEGWLHGCHQAAWNPGANLAWRVVMDNELAGDEITQTMGLWQLDEDGHTHDIRLIGYVPPLRFQQTLVHEMTHAYANDIGFGTRTYIEGFCNYVACCFLESRADGTSATAQEARARIELLESNDNVTYGVAFNKIRGYLSTRRTAAVAYLRTNTTMP